MSKLDPIIKKIESLDLSTLELAGWLQHRAEEKYNVHRKLYYTFVVPIEGKHSTTFTLYYTAYYEEGFYRYAKSEWYIELPNDVRFGKYDFDIGFKIHVEEFAKVQIYESDADVALSMWGFSE